MVSIIYSASLKAKFGKKEDNKKDSSRFSVFKFSVRSELPIMLQKLFFIICQSTFLKAGIPLSSSTLKNNLLPEYSLGLLSGPE